MPNFRVKVRIEMNRMGDVTVEPVSDEIARAYRAAVVACGGPDESRIYFHGDHGDEILDTYCSPAQARDVHVGWGVTVLIDPWDLGHLYGYDASENVELPRRFYK